MMQQTATKGCPVIVAAHQRHRATSRFATVRVRTPSKFTHMGRIAVGRLPFKSNEMDLGI
jgi:hypothetical protein